MTPGQVADMARWQKTMFDAGWVHLSNLLGCAKNAIANQAVELTALRAERDAALARVATLEMALELATRPRTEAPAIRQCGVVYADTAIIARKGADE